MSFTPNVLSQRDPRWKDEQLGFNPSVTLGTDGDALTCLAMLVNGFGFNETPSSLNAKLKALGNGVGFLGGLIVWPGLASAFPGLLFQRIVVCRDTPAPIADIDASLDAGQPLLVEIDRSPTPGLQNHWVLVYARQADDYLILDPFPQPPDNAPARLIARYGADRHPAEFISTVAWYDLFGAPTPAPVPASTPEPVFPSQPVTPPEPVPAPQPVTPPPSPPAPLTLSVRVLESIGAVGLRLRDQPDANANTLAILSAGAALTVLEPPDQVRLKVGQTGQWLNVATLAGLSGYVLAWFVEPCAAVPPASAPQPSLAASALTVVVSSQAAPGLRLRDRPGSASKILMILPPGTPLSLVEAPGAAREKIGVKNQWLNVREPGGTTGFVAAWYVTQ